eukprot:gene18477-biopygen18968
MIQRAAQRNRNGTSGQKAARGTASTHVHLAAFAVPWRRPGVSISYPPPRGRSLHRCNPPRSDRRATPGCPADVVAVVVGDACLPPRHTTVLHALLVNAPPPSAPPRRCTYCHGCQRSAPPPITLAKLLSLLSCTHHRGVTCIAKLNAPP